jgi:sortase (surface protein transpeptidase)
MNKVKQIVVSSENVSINIEKKSNILGPSSKKHMDIVGSKSKLKKSLQSSQLPTKPDQSLATQENKIGHVGLLPSVIDNNSAEPVTNILANDKKSRKKSRKNKKISLILYFLAAIILLFGIGMSINQYLTNRRNDKQAQHYVDLANAGRPSPAPATIKPSADDINKYKVAPNMPRYLIIPSLNVFARVRSVGVDKTGAVGTPTNVFDTAWYNQSSLPGQPGAALIDGHVSSWKTNGVFYGLKNIKPGELVKVQRGDGKIFTFSVVKNQVYSYDSVDMTAVLSPINPGLPGLNLITCTGKVIHGTNEFNQRIVIFTKLISQT